MLARLFVIAALCAVARRVPAQTTDADLSSSPAVGDRIRFAAPGIVAGQYLGVVRQRSADGLTVAGRSTTIDVPLARVSVLQVSRGRSRLDGAIRGTLWGAPLGLLSGLISRTAYGRCDGRCGSGNEYGYPDRGIGVVASSTASIAVAGAIIGAMVGRERWASVRGLGDAH